MPDEPRTPPNRLLVPLIAACVVCVAEAVVIAFLLGRGAHPGAPAPAAQASASGTAPLPPTPAPQPSPAPAAAPPSKPAEAPAANPPAVVRGKVNQRVEAGGLAITVLDVADQPRVSILTPPGGQKFADCDVLLENTGPRAMTYYAVRFKIQDDQARLFDGNSIAGGGPQLGYGTLVPGGKARGHVAFDLPKDAKGLKLTYPVDTAAQPQSIEIDLGR
jgi:hypothetical protein